jgi:hypothetical protein
VLTQYLVDPAELPWKPGRSEGITFQCQVLLGGADGGPEAFRFRFDPCPSIYAHMHLTCQFQLLLGGSMDFPTETMKLRPAAVHYTDHNIPYGPFAVGASHDMMVLHPKQGGLISMADRSARKQINLPGRELLGTDNDAEWVPIRGRGNSYSKILIPRSLGPEAIILQLAPDAFTIPDTVPTYGRYEVVLKGVVVIEGRVLGSPAFRYVRGNEHPPPLRAGPDGATLALLSFDSDALAGGLTGEGLSVVAAQAMARAI